MYESLFYIKQQAYFFMCISWSYLLETFHFWTHLPNVAKRKIEIGIRTAWTVAIFILLFYYYQWSASLTFFSGILSIVSHDLYFGRFMESYYQVMVATVIGSSFGTMVSYVSFNTQWQLAVLFISLVIINRITVWERTSRVIATLTCFLAAFTTQSIVTNDDGRRTSGELTMQVSVLLIFVPYTITAFCILIPYPGLALVSGCRKTRRVLLNLRKIVSNVIHSFHDIDSIDVFITEADILITETKPIIEYIAGNSRYGANESLFIPAGDLPAFLKTFSAFASQLVDDSSGLIAMLKPMPLNLTHLLFADRLRSGLSNFANEVDQILLLMEQRLNQVDFYPSLYRQLCSGWKEYNASILEEQENLVIRYRESVEKLNHIREVILKEYREIRINYVFYKAVRTSISQSFEATSTFDYTTKEEPVNFINDTIKSSRLASASASYIRLSDNNDNLKENSVTSLSSRYIESVLSRANSLPEVEMRTSEAKGNSKTGLFRRNFSAVDRFSHPPAPSRVEHIVRSLESHRVDIVQSYFEGSHQTVDDIRPLVERETEHLSVKNISYRSAFFCRLFLLQSSVSTSECVFTQKNVPASVTAFLLGEMLSTCIYFVSFKDMKIDYTYVISLIQPAKIAGAVTLTGLFITVPKLAKNINGPLWPGITICFIRQDASASSFLTSYQRLEGTVIGCFFSIVVYTTLKCPDEAYCNPPDLAPFLIVWTAVCCFFREGPMHGYTGVTAALTPLVLLLGSYVDSEINIIFRVANTVIAIIIYLLIDMLILPTRTDATVRNIVIRCMTDTTDAFANAVDAVQHLLMYCNHTIQVTPQQCSMNEGKFDDAHSTCCHDPNTDAFNDVVIKSSFGIDGSNSQTPNHINSDKEGLTQIEMTGLDTDSPINFSFNLGLTGEISLCDCSLERYEVAIKSMIKRQKGLVAVLALGVHEPNILNRFVSFIYKPFSMISSFLSFISSVIDTIHLFIYTLY